MSTHCMNPFELKQHHAGTLVPCGSCYNCRRRMVSSWSIRLINEGDHSHDSHFVTLTYNNDHLPLSKMGFQTLVKKDVQTFMKRLRKLHPLDHKTIKYFAVGEYGSKTKRPHYHLILFNANPLLIEKAWSLNNQAIGTIYIGQVCEASIGYCLKYISKICYIGTDPKKDDRQKNFRLMSKGLGINYLTENMKAWHKANPTERVYTPLKDGKKAPLSRYYKQKIYDESEKEKIALHFQNKANISLEKLQKEHGDNLQSYLNDQYAYATSKMFKNKNNKL